MKIAYASPDEQQCRRFGAFVEHYFAERQTEAELALFSKPEDMLESIAENVYDAVFLNMTYADQSGVQYVYKIRSFNPNVAVIVMKFTAAGRVECILTHPTLIILDDFSEQSVGVLLEQVTNRLAVNPERSVLVRTVQNVGRVIPVTAIVYAESNCHRLNIHLVSGEVIECMMPTNQLAHKLEIHSEFLFPHRSYIVNAFYVQCISTDRLFLRSCAVTIPIARGKLKSVQEAYQVYFESYRRDTNQTA